MTTKNTTQVNGAWVRNISQYKNLIDDAGRECTKCGTYKLWEDYGLYSRSPFGRRAVCRQCMNSFPKRDRAASNKKWRENLKATDPLKLKARVVKSGMRKRSELPSPTANEIEAWLKQQEMVCAYSGIALTIDTMSVDHVIPLERGGTNELSNLCVCSKEMNITKGTMLADEFRALLALVGGWEDGGRMLARLRMAGHAFGSK